MLRVIDPEAVSSFVGYIKQESAHALNRLLGRKKKTIWEEGFDSPLILDSDKAFEQFVYVLLNPVKDKLVSCMDDYPGVSSYSCLKSNQTEIMIKRIFRSSIKKLKDPHRPWLEEDTYRFAGKEGEEMKLKLFFTSWKKCFLNTSHLSDEQVKDKLLECLRLKQEEFPPLKLDANRLKRQSILMPYVPTSYGKRTICLSSSIEERKSFIRFYRNLCEEARAVFNQWRLGNLLPFPLGLFPPSLPRMANLLPIRL